MGQGEDRMIMVTGEQPCPLPRQPALSLEIRALRTRPMTTRVVPDTGDVAVGARLDMPAQSGRPALHDGACGSADLGGERVHLLVGWKRLLEDGLERWSRRTASVLPFDSGFPPSAPRTGQVAFTTSGAPIPATSAFSHILPAVGFESLVLSRWLFLCPECLDPFALHPALSDSLGGRHSTDYYGSAAPTRALVTSPPIHMGSSCRFRRCSHSNFPIGCRYPSVILQTCEQAREAYPHRQVVFEAPPPPSSRRGFWS